MKAVLNFENATIASKDRRDTQPGFKALLKREYHQPGQGDLFDMATGKCLPHSIVVASHIFQHKWQHELSQWTSLTDINDTCNGLLLYRSVEWAFNRAKICVEVNSQEEITFCLLDQGLRDVKLVDKAGELRSESNRGHQPLMAGMELQMTFGELDEQPLKFPDNVVMRPSKRLLGLHALLAQWTAQDRTPCHRARRVAYNISDDQTTKQAIKNLSILTWRAGVDCHLPVSVSHQRFGHTILTCCLGSLQHNWPLTTPRKDPMFEIPHHRVRVWPEAKHTLAVEV
jgi:hypothetical protein